MNRGVLQSSPVQQMVGGGGPNWWNINNMRPPPQQTSSFLAPPSNFFPHYTPPPAPQPPPPTTTTTSSLPISSSSWHDLNQEVPQSWSQLLLGGGILVGEEEKSDLRQMDEGNKKMGENWEDHDQQILHDQAQNGDHVKQENSSGNSYVYVHGNIVEYQTVLPKPTWSSQLMMPASSPNSCVTSLSGTNLLDFSTNKLADKRHPPPDLSSECNSTVTGGALKKARVQPSSTPSTFKVRKEKLGDRITALHQIVSPFGKTDTASVLLEAIGYIRFLQSQIEALSLPYLGSGSGNTRQQHSVQGERNCLFPEDPGQLLNDSCMKRKGACDQQECNEEPNKDLRSRGLCLVPISCTLQVGSDNGADYWAPALNGGFQ